MQAMKKSHDFFAERGAFASDHGIEKPYDGAATDAEAEAILQKVLSG
ncbi:MAG: glucuronate isomerase, partial [Lentisphaeria bacterium]|nr:glucuronate isomerase [Lentisphaeria bacterium]